MDEKLIQNSMQIILHAGDARVFCKNALNALAEFDIEKSEEEIRKANQEIVKAHRIQTDCIQNETRGEKSEYSLLLTHAQDTLMTIYSEINIAKQLIKISNGIDHRFNKIEKQLGGRKNE